MDLKISIITPSLNQANFLEQSIDSVLSQNYPDLDYIIIDGGSTDGSVDIIRKYKKHITYWESLPDSGQSNAINKGFLKSSGDVINWLNSDDYLEPNALMIIADSIADPTVKVLCGQSRLYDEAGTIKKSKGTDIYKNNISKNIGWARIDQPVTFFRRETWIEVGLLNEQLHYTMDREWWMRYLYKFGLNGIKQIKDILANFRIHDNSKTVLKKKEFQVEHDTLFYKVANTGKSEIIKELIAEICEINDELKSEIEDWTDVELSKKVLNYYLLKRTDEFYYQNEKQKAKKFLEMVKKEWLAPEDIPLYKKLKMKLKIPTFLIQLIRG